MPTDHQQSGFPALVSHFHVHIGQHVLSLAYVSEICDAIEQKNTQAPPLTVVLRRAITQDKFLFNWFRDTRLGKDTSANVTLIQLSAPRGDEINRWLLIDARPLRWIGPLFDALGNELSMESLEISYKRIEWADPKKGGRK